MIGSQRIRSCLPWIQYALVICFEPERSDVTSRSFHAVDPPWLSFSRIVRDKRKCGSIVPVVELAQNGAWGSLACLFTSVWTYLNLDGHYSSSTSSSRSGSCCGGHRLSCLRHKRRSYGINSKAVACVGQRCIGKHHVRLSRMNALHFPFAKIS